MHSCNRTDGDLTCTNGFGGVPSYSHWVGLHMSSARHVSLNEFKLIMCRHVEMKWRCSLESFKAARRFIIFSCNLNDDDFSLHAKKVGLFCNAWRCSKSGQCRFWQNLPKLEQSCNIRPKTISRPADLSSILHLHRHRDKSRQLIEHRILAMDWFFSTIHTSTLHPARFVLVWKHAAERMGENTKPL